jgi:hypothetical protein
MNLIKWARNQWDRVGAVLLALGAVVAILLGWLGVSRSAYPAESMPYIVSGGFFGLLLMGAAAVLWLSADMRDEWRKLDSIEHAWHDAGTRPGPMSAATAAPPVRSDSTRASSATR